MTIGMVQMSFLQVKISNSEKLWQLNQKCKEVNSSIMYYRPDRRSFKSGSIASQITLGGPNPFSSRNSFQTSALKGLDNIQRSKNESTKDIKKITKSNIGSKITSPNDVMKSLSYFNLV